MSDLFEWTVPPMELVARGTLIYLGLVLCFRYLLRRDMGSMSTPDLLFVVLIADAAQNAMAGEYKSVGDGAVLLGTLIFWNIALDWLAYRSETFRRFIGPPPLPLIRNFGRWQSEFGTPLEFMLEELGATRDGVAARDATPWLTRAPGS